MKLGIVDVGGGLRGVYAAGVFDYCLEEGSRSDLCIGVSAGMSHIRHIREKIETDSKNPRYIENIRRVCYRFKKSNNNQ